MRYALPVIAPIIAVAALGTAAIGAPQMGSPSAELKAAIASPTRTPANVARDSYRHPAETLAFFGVKPSDTVVEIWPGGGWYSEILVPYLGKGGGTYYAAAMDAVAGGTKRMMATKPELYGTIKMAAFPAFAATDTRVPDGSADVVLTFRNVHNWRMGYQHPDKQDYAAEAFKQMFAMLKPGGILGVVDHRLPERADAERERSSGYIKTSTVKKLAADAGFELVAESRVNANPKDTADWPNGVWTLPPSYALKDVDRAKYAAIGESDRMTLKFKRPR